MHRHAPRSDSSTVHLAVDGPGLVAVNFKAFPTVRLGDDATVIEGEPAQLSVDLEFAGGADVLVDYVTEDASAVAGVDYVASGGTVTIPAGQTRAIITVPTITRPNEQGERSLSLLISNARVVVGADVAALEITETAATINIEDVDEPPIPPAGDYPYFDGLGQRADCFKQESLRDAERLPLLTSKDVELAVSYDPVRDAAKIVIPPFGFSVNPANLVSGEAPDLNLKAIPLTSVANVTHSTQYKVADCSPDVITEITRTGPSNAYRDQITNEMLVEARGMYGTPAQALAAGTRLYRASNSTYNQIWVPFKVEAGHSLFITWDAIFGREWMRNGIGAMKVWQVDGDGNIYFEPRVIWGGNIGGRVGRPPGYDDRLHVGAVDARCYGQPRGATTLNSPCLPMVNQFIVWPDRVTRWHVWIELAPAPEFMRASMWLSDEQQEPLQILDRLEFTTRGALTRWRGEFNTSTNYLPAGRCMDFPDLGLKAFRPMISWARNVSAHLDVPAADLPGLIVKPPASVSQHDDA